MAKQLKQSNSDCKKGNWADKKTISDCLCLVIRKIMIVRSILKNISIQQFLKHALRYKKSSQPNKQVLDTYRL